MGSDNAALIVEGSIWLNLEDGIQIQFQPASKGTNQYRTGDYWLIPARTATANVETGTGSVPPDGVDHHYAPLAVITVPGPAGGVVINKNCQQEFTPMAHPVT